MWSDDMLRARGVSVCRAPRGGQSTLHAPGQLVAYPVVRVGRQVRRHVARLGLVAARLLAELGVRGAELRMDPLGVWANRRKLASIGVHVGHGVAVQGVAINLDVDGSLFAALVSCGMPDVEMASASQLGADVIDLERAARRFAELYADSTGQELRFVPA